MNAAIAWFARNSVAANLLMALLLVGGFTSLPRIPQQEFPDIDVPLVNVSVEYLGAAPEEVEEGICVRIEEQIDGVEGVDELRSTATEGMCVVTAELLTEADESKALDDIKARVDALDTLPEEAERPVVELVTMTRAAVDVALSGDAPERTLKELADRIRDELAALPTVTQVGVSGARPYEISIEVSEAALRRHGLRFDQVAAAVRRSSLDLPGGSIKTRGGDILLRTKGQAYRGAEFEEIVVLTRGDGTRVYLRDVASVVDGFADTDQKLMFDGELAVMLQVYRIGDQDLIEIVTEVRAYVEEAQARLPEGMHLTVWRDGSVALRGRIDTMLRNGRAGFGLVLLVLALFLRTRLAFWVALGVPISFAGALFLLPVFDITLNQISMFALILVLGILVDDAIVVGENIYTHQRKHENPLQAATRGAQEVAVPVFFGVTTTMVAFMPMLLVGGTMGQIFSVMATVVMVCLLFSLVESQWILPAHLGHGRPADDTRSRTAVGERWRRFQDGFASGLEAFIDGPYRRRLETSLHWRYTTLALGIAMLACAFAVVASGHLRFTFFPALQSDYVTAALTMPQGTPAVATGEAVAQVEAAADSLRRELDAEYGTPERPIVKHVLTAVGEQPSKNRGSQNPSNVGRVTGAGGHLGEVAIELVPAEERPFAANDVAQMWRERLPDIADVEELQFLTAAFTAGEEINIQLQGPDIADLREASGRVQALLAEYPGVIDISDSFQDGKQEVKLAILPSAEALGLSLQDLARQVRQAFYGEEAQRVQRGRHDVKVMVRYPETERRSLGDLENLRVRTLDGGEVPFRSVAQAELGRGFSTIRRAERQRVINVTADVDRARVTADQVLNDLRVEALPAIAADYTGLSYSLEGIQREQRRAMGALFAWTLVAMFGIYALLAVPLRSYVQPFLIMSVIPFGIVGAVFGHVVMGLYKPGFSLTFMSVTGIVALTGVVVNGSLVLIYTLNRLRDQGADLPDATIGAAMARFRPIVLTSITTFVGLLPLLLERSMQAQFLVPMATSLAFGVVFATLITLFLLPSGILVLDDLARLPERLRRRRRGAPAATPAMPGTVAGGD